jgi:hypothetical protein
MKERRETYEINDFWTPKSYTVDKITEEMVSLIEEEFLFTLPEGAVIDHISIVRARESTGICHIKGEFSPEDFIEHYAHFKVDEPVQQLKSSISLSVSGFSDHWASVSLNNNGSTTEIIISRRGGVSNELLKHAYVRKGLGNLVF